VLVIFDLDNTLIDRQASFIAWAEWFIAKGGGVVEDDLPWLLEADAEGYTPKHQFFAQVNERFELSTTFDEFETQLRAFLSHPVCDEATLAALRRLKSENVLMGIATNGSINQEEKIRNAGLDKIVNGWCISEAVGSKKPDARIFELLAQACGTDLSDCWVVGDGPESDIRGAFAIDAKSIWISRGTTWKQSNFAPTFATESVAQAVDIICARISATGPRA
jgi:putative hydrolase of the HAD superfamily